MEGSIEQPDHKSRSSGQTVTTDDLTRWELLGPAGRFDEAMQRKLDPYLGKFCVLQWQQVGLMNGMD